MNGGYRDAVAVDRETLLAANEDAARFYRSQLFARESPGPRSYLADRGFGALLEETPWTVGYAATGWTSLIDHLDAQGYSDATLLDAGLVCRTRHGTLIDRFRDRVTFGIRNAEGELVAFTARGNPSAPAAVPKYLNTPSTALYSKSKTPFGLGEQHDSIREGAAPVLVEGPFDAVAVHMAREESDRSFAALALCGTAISGSLVESLERLNSRSVLLAFDRDDAGTLATERAACALAATFVDVRATGGTGEGDPAELLVRSGSRALSAQLAAARPAIDRVVDARMDMWANRLDNAEARVACLREVAALLARLRPSDAAHHVRRLSERLSLRPETVTCELVEATCRRQPEPAPRQRSSQSHRNKRWRIHER